MQDTYFTVMIFGIRVLLYPFSNCARVELQVLSRSDPPKLVRHRQPPGSPHRAEETFGEKGCINYVGINIKLQY